MSNDVAVVHPLPEWVEEFRDHQATAIKQITEAYKGGARVVMLDAPTGTGKTLVGQQVASELGVTGTYVCSDKQLQDQFLRDFEYARVLKGRGNYPTQLDPARTAEDCTNDGGDDGCWYCSEVSECAYQVAKQQALAASMAVLNTDYLLSAANFARTFTGRDLVIADECDRLEGTLMGFVELRIGKRVVKECGLVPPKPRCHKPTLVKWLMEFSDAVTRLAKTYTEPKEQRKLRALGKECRFVAEELVADIEANASGEDVGKWLRDYDDYAALILKPVSIKRYGEKYLWQHGKRWLLMSASIISDAEMADSLGLDGDWELVRVPMTFPVENRRIIMAPVANVIYKDGGMDIAIPRLVQAIKAILTRHPGERVLVHAVSYSLAQRLVDGLKGTNRPVLTYRRSVDRASTLTRYLSTPGAVLVAPSMERGVDLPGDACRVQVVAKVPFPNLKDRQISAHMYLPNGQLWYDVQAMRDLVQMTGRAVRSETDTCKTYILDQMFTKLWNRNKYLFPAWWSEAVDTRFPIRELLR